MDPPVFPLKEPDGYREANEKMLELAAAHPERLDALARLDPANDPLAEAERCLDGGAVGLKLHPRGEDFEISDPRLDEVFALSEAPVRRPRPEHRAHRTHGNAGGARQQPDPIDHGRSTRPPDQPRGTS